MTDLPDRAQLERAARAVLAQLDSYDLDRVLASGNGLDDLLHRMVVRAEEVCALWPQSIPPDQHELLALCVLTRTRGNEGVHIVAGRAASWLRTYLQVPGLAVPAAFVVAEKDPVPLIRAIDQAYRAGTALATERAEWPLHLTLVSAVAACQRPDPAGPQRTTVELAAQILDRGMELAAAYEAGDTPLPDVPLPVVGDRRFLVQLAAYACAARELREDGARGEPLAEVAAYVQEIAQWTRREMSRRRRHRFDGNEGFDAAMYFAAAADIIDRSADRDGDESVGRPGGSPAAGAGAAVQPQADVVFRRLTRGLGRGWLTANKKIASVQLETLPPALAPGDDTRVLTRIIAVDALADRVLGVLTAGTNRADRAVLANWVCGSRAVDQFRVGGDDDLYLLLSRLRRVMLAVADPQASPARPLEPDAADVAAMRTALRRRIAAAISLDAGRLDPQELVAAALPPLWTSRQPVIRALRAQIRNSADWTGPRSALRRAPEILAARAVRGPGQITRDTIEPQHAPTGRCITFDPANLDAAPRCGTRASRLEVDPAEICPARPWGEPGRVDSRATIGDLFNLSVASVRGYLNRYRENPDRWAPLIEADQP
ncbi:hypothetical protein E0F15_19740 [Frankia sp. B2]|nr:MULTISPECIES: hypothetical protein [Frankia]KDA41544.1 hypothetical protein BMG523Draft_03612 [Frankia sp. BMG5.23]ORT48822.1 hypothetical protein KBI5_15215 [Frankia sp. KB5]TFE25501.1 hypothetical protein E0F15_19740 [Frankia sp. B2]